jgi:hypothetical protein
LIIYIIEKERSVNMSGCERGRGEETAETRSGISFFPCCFVNRLFNFQTDKKLVALRLAVNQFADKNDISPLNLGCGTGVQLLIYN